jgi:integrase
MGLVKKINKDKSITWFIRYSAPIDGTRCTTKDKWEAIGPSKREAEIVLGKRLAQIREGKFFETSAGAHQPYSELIDRYLQYSKTAKKPKTYRPDQGLARQLKPALGSYKLKDLTPARVLRYIDAQLEAGKAPATVNSRWAFIKHSFSKAVEWGLLRESENAVGRAKCPFEVKNQRTCFLTAQEIDRLVSVASPLWRAFILIAVHTDMRKGEILTLRKDHLYLEEGLLLLRTHDTKTSEPRPVFLNEAACAVLREIVAEQKNPSPWVFYNPKTKTHYREDFDTGWYSALKKAGLENVHFHDLRHTTASHLVMSGATLKDVQEALGHKRIDTMLRYAHLSLDHRRAVMRRLDRVLTPSRAVD